MKYKVLAFLSAFTLTNSIEAQQLNISKVKFFEHQLDDVMEIIDTTALKTKLNDVASDFRQAPTEMSKARLGIIYHETALNLGFVTKTTYKGYAQKSYGILNELCLDTNTSKELLPIATAYRASALALL